MTNNFGDPHSLEFIKLVTKEKNKKSNYNDSLEELGKNKKATISLAHFNSEKKVIEDNVKSKVGKIIELSFAYTLESTVVKVLEEKQAGNISEYKLELKNPGKIVSNNKNYREVGYQEDSRQSYYKKDEIKLKYYYIIIDKEKKKYTIHNGKTKRSKTIRSIPYIDVKKLINNLVNN